MIHIGLRPKVCGAIVGITIVAAAVFSSGSAIAQTGVAVFAGGCFWCVESDFDSIEGVTATISGYTGGTTENPSYKSVTSGKTGHYEAVRVEYDRSEVTYRELVDMFWRSVDPTDDGGQFCDRGDSYRTAVFVMDEQQRMEAEASKAVAQYSLGKTIVTPILDAGQYYPAEDYHQDYYLGTNLVITRFGIIRQSEAYKRYRMGCGRDLRVKTLWGDQAIFAH